jgi:hypothetical protein
MKLTNPTDEQLDRAFAENVAQLTPEAITFLLGTGDGKLGYTKSVDAVLPFLEGGLLQFASARTSKRWTVRAWRQNEPVMASDDSFSRAVVIALLRAHGVEVEFGK